MIYSSYEDYDSEKRRQERRDVAKESLKQVKTACRTGIFSFQWWNKDSFQSIKHDYKFMTNDQNLLGHSDLDPLYP